MVDWIPVVSQVKAGFQLVTGDVEGARQTNENFVKECPGVSQLTSLVQLADGDKEGAIETQKRCFNTVNKIANATPGLGHVKAEFHWSIIHHATGDTEAGNQALNAATRSTVAVGAAAATGGGTVVAAGAGMVYDAVSSTVTQKSQGTIRNIEKAVKNPSAGSIFDASYIIGQPVIKSFVPLSSNPIIRDFESEESSSS